MKVLVFFAIIFTICSLGLASESMGFNRDPAHPGKCVYGDLILSPGEEAKLPNDCARIICFGEYYTVQTCGVMGAPSGCKYTDYININAPYSECCERKLECENQIHM